MTRAEALLHLQTTLNALDDGQPVAQADITKCYVAVALMTLDLATRLDDDDDYGGVKSDR